MIFCPTKDSFQCKFNECIPWSYLCDGIAHCSNKADENCDMCTNDLYVCRDSSRINCTLACLTLGYIPCKNYMDKKICANVLKNKNLKFTGSGYYDTQSMLIEKNKISSESILITVLGLLVFITMAVLLVLLAIFYKRFKRSAQARLNAITNQQQHQQQNNTEHLNINNTSNNLIENNNYDNFLTPKKIHKKNLKLYNNEKTDYNQLYGEPPPSYKVAKYFPKANSSSLSSSSCYLKKEEENKCLTVSSVDDEKACMQTTTSHYSHIYENIDESDESVSLKEEIAVVVVVKNSNNEHVL